MIVLLYHQRFVNRVRSMGHNRARSRFGQTKS